jgi:hypothetical protein
LILTDSILYEKVQYFCKEYFKIAIRIQIVNLSVTVWFIEIKILEYICVRLDLVYFTLNLYPAHKIRYPSLHDAQFPWLWNIVKQKAIRIQIVNLSVTVWFICKKWGSYDFTIVLKPAITNSSFVVIFFAASELSTEKKMKIY